MADIDISSLSKGLFEKYQNPLITQKGKRIAAPDLRKESQVEIFQILSSEAYLVAGFRNKDLRAKLSGNAKTANIAYELRKLRERGAIKKIKNSHYYQLTEEGYVWIYF